MADYCSSGHDLRIPGSRDKFQRCKICYREYMRVYMREHRKTQTPEQKIASLERRLEKAKALAEQTRAQAEHHLGMLDSRKAS